MRIYQKAETTMLLVFICACGASERTPQTGTTQNIPSASDAPERTQQPFHLYTAEEAIADVMASPLAFIGSWGVVWCRTLSAVRI